MPGIIHEVTPSNFHHTLHHMHSYQLLISICLLTKKPVSHVKEIPAFLPIMHLVGLGGAWFCRL